MKPDDVWYEIRDGQYFCKACDLPLVGVTVKEAFVLNAPTVAAHYHCDGCKRSAILPSPH
jgi:hypothetical protein